LHRPWGPAHHHTLLGIHPQVHPPPCSWSVVSSRIYITNWSNWLWPLSCPGSLHTVKQPPNHESMGQPMVVFAFLLICLLPTIFHST
jgi:hypothetical protein